MPKKLIEVALPLIDINQGGFEEKKLPHGLVANMHNWWARRPQAVTRAVLFAQLVDDPSSHPEEFTSPAEIEKERARLFAIIRELAAPSGPSEATLEEAKHLIRKCIGDDVTVLDPFAGGGSIPIEAQRLGVHVEASDLNPIPVLINRVVLDQMGVALGRSAVHPSDSTLVGVSGAQGLSGLAEDLRWYGNRLRELARQAIGHLYPTIKDESGREYPVVAWLWARTIPCPNPACGSETPLVRSFVLSKKKGREAWVEPTNTGPGSTVEFIVRQGGSPKITGTVGRAGAKCVACHSAIPLVRVREDARKGLMKFRLMAIAAAGDRRRHYFSPLPGHVEASEVEVSDPFGTDLAPNKRNITCRIYGLTTHASLYTSRQLKTLITLSELLPNIRSEVMEATGGDTQYSDLVVSLLAMSVSKLANRQNALVPWDSVSERPAHLFARQAIPMVWDFAEGDALGEASCSLVSVVAALARSIDSELMAHSRGKKVTVAQANAATREYTKDVIVCTDPPYFDNISYADLADFFYVWLRHSLGGVHPDLFQTLLTPKAEELVAMPHRFDDDQRRADEHFEQGFRAVFAQIREHHHRDVPLTVYYAYKQEDNEGTGEGGGSGAGATGWEKLLQGMVDTGMRVTATWPLRTERGARMLSHGTNALASSVVLTCRIRPDDAGITDRQGFIRHLRRDMAEKLPELQSGGVQPVDMAQASIGPGMAVFTSYAKVLEGGDKQMSVGTALQIINQVLDELQTEQEAEFDSDTRWAVTWFDQHGMNAADFGDAQNIATARGTAVNALERAGIIEARAGRVRLLTRDEYADDWDPTTDKRLTVWEVCQHLIRRIEGDGGLMAAAALLRQVGGLGEAARDLAYRLYEIANRNGWSEEARAYNNLAAEWPDLAALAAQAPSDPSTLF